KKEREEEKTAACHISPPCPTSLLLPPAPAHVGDPRRAPKAETPLPLLQRRPQLPTPAREEISPRDVFIAVKTTKKFHKARLELLLDTWISRNQEMVSRLCGLPLFGGGRPPFPAGRALCTRTEALLLGSPRPAKAPGRSQKRGCLQRWGGGRGGSPAVPRESGRWASRGRLGAFISARPASGPGAAKRAGTLRPALPACRLFWPFLRGSRRALALWACSGALPGKDFLGRAGGDRSWAKRGFSQRRGPSCSVKAKAGGGCTWEWTSGFGAGGGAFPGRELTETPGLGMQLELGNGVEGLCECTQGCLSIRGVKTQGRWASSGPAWK
uniref:Fringe-like glycosyltransferase domain-containing protein n=1 Tax=Laticauda laticaudata TaxID=8630 RepID=A0A8C5S3E7_LATLA